MSEGNPRRGSTVEPSSLIGPVTEGTFSPPVDLLGTTDLAAIGYIEEEWFASGEATSYRLVGPRHFDGRWDVEPAASAHYRTRLVVRRPSDPMTWSGTVFVEWLNVSGGIEVAAAWVYAGAAMADAGVAYVAVSAQALGPVGGMAALGGTAPAPGLRDTNPDRYGALEHPGDAYSFAILSQVGAALRSPLGAEALGGTPASVLIAGGESQSAAFLTSYINAAHPVARVYDGFFVHSRPSIAADLDGSPGFEDHDFVEDAVQVRSDVGAPVFILETETDVGPLLGYSAARQDDTDMIRTWEVAGTAHADAHFVGGDFAGCPQKINDGPHHYVAKAAVAALVRWVRHGDGPPRAEPIRTDGVGRATVIVRDERGIAEGGVRTPSVDVPTSILSGDAPPGGPFYCELFGSSAPLDEADLRALYGTTDDYVAAFTASVRDAVDAGYVRAEDADAYVAEAKRIVFRG